MQRVGQLQPVVTAGTLPPLHLCREVVQRIRADVPHCTVTCRVIPYRNVPYRVVPYRAFPSRPVFGRVHRVGPSRADSGGGGGGGSGV